MGHSRTSVVLAALFANIAIACLKFGAYLLTHSPAMLAETYHSLSDTGTQIFLLIGLRRGECGPTNRHPFGRGKAAFFYSFLASVMLFGVAGVQSAREGWHALGQPDGGLILTGTVTVGSLTVPAVYVNYVVLLGALVFEAWALKRAHANLSQQMADHGWTTVQEAFHKSSDVTTLAALTEDTVSVSGVCIAILGVVLTRVTGNPMYDALAALLIGVLLMGFSLMLAWEIKRLLVGESLPDDDEAELLTIIRAHDEVTKILDFRTLYFGPEQVLVAADVTFKDNLRTTTIEETIDELEDALKARNSAIQKVYIEPDE